VIRRSLLEWRSLNHGDHPVEEIPEWAAERLAAAARTSPLAGAGGKRVLVHGRHDLRAQGVVGVVAAKDCSLEILPKIEGCGDGSDSESRGRLRERLVHMLAVALDMKIDVGGGAAISWQRETLLEILIGLFARKLADAVRRGLPRRYVAREQDLTALRGRLDAVRQFTALAASPQRLACRYDALSADIALNRIMKAAVRRLTRLSRSVENQRLLRELAFAYADVSPTSAASLRFDDVVLDRTNARWRELLGLARLLLGDRFQTTTTGAAEGYALLFEMSPLFEEYVARTLSRGLASAGLTVKRQGGYRFCLTETLDDGTEKGRFQTIPDMLIQKGGRTLMVIDTKWKRLVRRIDDPKRGLAQTDVYQMIAYGRLYECPELMLLYPWHDGLDADGDASRHYNVSRCEDRLSIATVDIARVTGIRTRLADLVLERLGLHRGIVSATGW